MALQFQIYGEFVSGIALYPDRGEHYGPAYCALGLAGEAGEVADKMKKILRDAGGLIDDTAREGLLTEMGDALWYIAALAIELGSSLEEVAVTNIEKLKARQAANTLRGEGDKR